MLVYCIRTVPALLKQSSEHVKYFNNFKYFIPTTDSDIVWMLVYKHWPTTGAFRLVFSLLQLVINVVSCLWKDLCSLLMLRHFLYCSNLMDVHYNGRDVLKDRVCVEVVCLKKIQIRYSLSGYYYYIVVTIIKYVDENEQEASKNIYIRADWWHFGNNVYTMIITTCPHQYMFPHTCTLCHTSATTKTNQIQDSNPTLNAFDCRNSF